MARTTKDAKLSNRTARTALALRPKPYFRLARGGAFPVHLGYRKHVKDRPGTWCARRYLGDQRYEMAAIGAADDDPRLPADGAEVLTFDQAQRAALAWADGRQSADRTEAAAKAKPATVRDAVVSYIAARKVRDPRAGTDAELRLTHHVLGSALADVALVALTDEHFAGWRSSITRGGRAAKKRAAPLALGTLARLLNDMRAALRASASASRLPAEVLATITAGCKRPEGASRARPKQVLQDADIRKIVAAADAVESDFGALVLVLAATGARFDQIARATVADFQAEGRRLMVPLSRKGRGTKAQSHVPVPLPDDVVARLRALVAGRPGHDPLLMRWHHVPVPGEPAKGRLPSWERAERRPWRHAAELTRHWHRALADAGLSAGLVPYSLRHSSIVRGLRAGLPVRLVAAVHDTSMAMIERHYAAFIVDQTEELLRRAVVPMAAATVSPIREVG
jgi:integrase